MIIDIGSSVGKLVGRGIGKSVGESEGVPEGDCVGLGGVFVDFGVGSCVG